jgi:CheY-like chemotaxis protein
VALNDNDRAVMVAAMQALGAMRYERGVQALTVLFRYYGKGEPAEAALDALARIAHPSSAPLLATQLLSTNAALRGIALEGLARLGDPSTLADIHAALNRERNAGVALAGAFALALLGDASTDRVADSLTRPTLHEQAKQYLIELAPGRASEFARHLLNPDERIRLDVVDALGLSGDSAAVPVVEPLTKDRDPGIARAAERAVARLRHAADDRSRSSRSALVHARARLAHSTVPADRRTRYGPKNRPIVTARRLLIRSAMADFSIPRVNAAEVKRHATPTSVGEWRHRTKSGETIQMADAVHDLTFAGRPARFVIAQDVIERAREVEEPREALAGDPHRLEGTETILLVEDEDVVREFVRKVLSRRGYTVHALADPRGAVEFGEAHWGAIHLILTDVVLPGMIGPAMAALLARQHPEAKILYMSGYTDGAIVRHGVLDPGMWFLQKPFTAEALAITVRDLLDLRRLAAR